MVLLVGVCLAWAAPAQAGWSVYVANFGDDPVSQLCTTASGLQSMVPATVPAATIGNLNADALAVGRDGRSVYVPNNSEDNIVDQLDVAANGTLTPKTPAHVHTPLDNPRAIALSPDGRSAYVVDDGHHNATDTTPAHGISQFDVGPGGLLSAKSPGSVASGSAPDAIAVSPDGRSVYVANGADSTVSQFDAGKDGKLAAKSPPNVATGSGPTAIAVSPDGRSVYVTNQNDNSVSQYDVGAGGALTPKTTATVGAGTMPSAVAVSPDGKSVYVTNAGFGGVSQYDVGTGGSLTAKAPSVASAGAQPEAIAVSPDSKSVFVANFGDGTVDQYDVGAGGVLKVKSTILLQHPAAGPDGIAVGAAVPCVFFKNDVAHIFLLGNATARIQSTLIESASVGILVERIVAHKLVRVGRVPFGPQRPGRLRIHWNLRVNDHKLPKGRYLITVRALNKHGHVIALAHPVKIMVR